MIFIKNNSEYPLFIGDLEVEHPGINLEDALPEGWEVVLESQKPEIIPGCKITESFPIKDGGIWKKSWQLVAMTEKEKASMAIKDIPVNPETI